MPGEIVADERERSSGVPAFLEDLGAEVEYKMLEVADYLVNGLAVERKTMRDFVSSLFDGRLFDQAYRSNASYDNSLLIVEGNVRSRLEELKNPRWFWGGLASLVLDYDVRCFFTPDQEQTAQLLYTLIGRGKKNGKRQDKERRPPPLIVRRPRSGELDRLQVSIVSGLPGVGPKLAEQLLTRFGSIRSVFEASATEMAVGAGIGSARALALRKLLDAQYKNPNPGQASLGEEEE